MTKFLSGFLCAVTVLSLSIAMGEPIARFFSSGDALIALYRTGAASTTTEGAFYMEADDASGVTRKVMSISSSQMDTSAANGFNVVRFNATYRENGVPKDDVSFRQFGGRGVQFCGLGGAPDGPNYMDDRCVGYHTEVHHFSKYVYFKDQGPVPPTLDGSFTFFTDPADGSLKVKFGNGTVKVLATNP